MGPGGRCVQSIGTASVTASLPDDRTSTHLMLWSAGVAATANVHTARANSERRRAWPRWHWRADPPLPAGRQRPGGVSVVPIGFSCARDQGRRRDRVLRERRSAYLLLPDRGRGPQNPATVDSSVRCPKVVRLIRSLQVRISRSTIRNALPSDPVSGTDQALSSALIIGASASTVARSHGQIINSIWVGRFEPRAANSAITSAIF